eukprot:SAG31_NODE_3238_length_4507_cov_14.674682_5_plen_62_part_00
MVGKNVSKMVRAMTNCQTQLFTPALQLIAAGLRICALHQVEVVIKQHFQRFSRPTTYITLV